MMRIPVAVATALAALAALAACAQDIRFVPGQGPVESLSDVERGVALLAIETLAADLGIPRERIELDTVRAVEWRDSSLGCPKPGVAYLDVVKPGHKVTLRVDRQIYVVHEAGNQAFVCRQNKALGGITPQRELEFGPQLVEARADLARRLGLRDSEIRFLSSEARTFPDASLGCPEPGEMYAQAQVSGWVLTFGVRDRTYTYHTDLHRTIPCPPIASQ
jgi:hypothetical protein